MGPDPIGHDAEISSEHFAAFEPNLGTAAVVMQTDWDLSSPGQLCKEG